MGARTFGVEISGFRELKTLLLPPLYSILAGHQLVFPENRELGLAKHLKSLSAFQILK